MFKTVELTRRDLRRTYSDMVIPFYSYSVQSPNVTDHLISNWYTCTRQRVSLLMKHSIHLWLGKYCKKI